MLKKSTAMDEWLPDEYCDDSTHRPSLFPLKLDCPFDTKSIVVLTDE